jgi:hypothetical protein
MKGLQNEEWVFSDLPNNELRICYYYYELNREVILQDIKQQESLNAAPRQALEFLTVVQI